ncbi:chromosome segregation protein SMC, partial [Actinoplanes sp. NPDC049596]
MASNTVPALTQVPGLAHAPTAAARSEAPTVPAHMLPQRTPAQLVTIARQGLDEAARTSPDGLRYAAAHLAALRAAAA